MENATVEWRALSVPGYEVSSEGEVRAGHRIDASGARRKPKILLQSRDKDGYMIVTLFTPEGRKYSRVHVLVLEAFTGPRPNGAIARHLNGNPADNRPSNLRWGSYKENAQDRELHGNTVKGAKFKNAVLSDAAVSTIRGLRMLKFGPADIAAMMSLNKHTVRHVVHRESWNHVK